ncbi:hypothetical protein LTR70_001368 [Exophiala xenobiotica]|uniref:Major facilitator superfamily (MFS) profile domain-containing protein n=1 Tax=Lithohypha guttulata TaxID=1690604 RepID=A0ABR0KPE9_9EURO|nr:hypothetical protein LTR24_000877 [Lithohypha guttulata]KAK5328047.1 hypothetical protein LTR70_001368 [Exophiala xenobiotica]
MSSVHSQHSTQYLPETRPSTVEDKGHGEAEKNYQLKSPRFWAIIIGVYLSLFLVALDRMIIAPAIPSITDEFHSTEDIGWYGSAYMLTAAIFFPLCGRIYQLYSTKWVFLASVLVFEVGSAVCAAAPSSDALIVGRGIAGIGSAGIFCGSMNIIIPLVPLRKRPIFTSVFGIAFGVSSVLGPVVGGAFTDNGNLTWRWCFYMNLPLGGCTIAVVFLFLHLESPPRDKLTILDQFKRLDPLGLLLFVLAMVCLVLALQWDGTTYPWSAPKIIGLLVTFAGLFIAFLAVEALTPKTAMVPTRVVLNRSVGGSVLFVFLLSGGMMAIIYYLTIWFQAAQGQSAIQAGIRSIPIVLCLAFIGIVAAIFVQKVEYYVPPLLISPVLCAVGAPARSRRSRQTRTVIYGIGISYGFQTSNLVPQNMLAHADVPLGMALMFSMQQLGSSVFLPVGQNLFSSPASPSMVFPALRTSTLRLARPHSETRCRRVNLTPSSMLTITL